MFVSPRPCECLCLAGVDLSVTDGLAGTSQSGDLQ